MKIFKFKLNIDDQDDVVEEPTPAIFAKRKTGFYLIDY